MRHILIGGVLALSFLQPLNSDAEQLRLDASDKDMVVFNLNSLKYHISSCSAAKHCTHCIEISRKQAKERGGVPCKLCGAGEQ